MYKYLILFLILLNSCSFFSQKINTDIPGVNFVNIKDGEQLINPVKIEASKRGIDEGRFALLVDSQPIVKGKKVEFNNQIIDFKEGIDSITVKLSPGPHTLILQLVDSENVSYGLTWSRAIEVLLE